jgi:NAD(P)-dependent dehydrogenase (short-subunit alcohol dehydrogenase family)
MGMFASLAFICAHAHAQACESCDRSLAGKKALVFGGTKGIGLATSKALISQGATVVAISRTAPEQLPKGITYASCDVLDREALKLLFQEHAPFEILVSTATGGGRSVGPFLQMNLDGFKASFDKLWGYANVVRLGTEHLSIDGSIVLVSGAPAKRSKPGQIALSAVGGAVENLVSVAAKLSKWSL